MAAYGDKKRKKTQIDKEHSLSIFSEQESKICDRWCNMKNKVGHRCFICLPVSISQNNVTFLFMTSRKNEILLFYNVTLNLWKDIAWKGIPSRNDFYWMKMKGVGTVLSVKVISTIGLLRVHPGGGIRDFVTKWNGTRGREGLPKCHVTFFSQIFIPIFAFLLVFKGYFEIVFRKTKISRHTEGGGGVRTNVTRWYMGEGGEPKIIQKRFHSSFGWPISTRWFWLWFILHI